MSTTHRAKPLTSVPPARLRWTRPILPGARGDGRHHGRTIEGPSLLTSAPSQPQWPARSRLPRTPSGSDPCAAKIPARPGTFWSPAS